MVDPKITPRPRSCWPLASAVKAVAISGESAPSAVTKPSRPSDKPRWVPTWSSRCDSTTLEMVPRTRQPRKRAMAESFDIRPGLIPFSFAPERISHQFTG